MMFRAVVFDLDGTLVDSLADIGESMNCALEELGFATHSLESYRVFVGDGVGQLARRALPAGRQDEATVKACVDAMRRVYDRHATSKTRPYDGVRELLDDLARRQVRVSVLSNKPHSLTVEVVREVLGDWTFWPVLGERAEVPRKPDPAGALEIARLLGVPTAEVLYVGDTPTDMRTAAGAGMVSVGATWGFRGESELVAAGADRIARHPRDILNFLR